MDSSSWWSIVLEIVKITVPALIVFLTVYYLLKQYLDGQYRLRLLDYKQQRSESATPVRMQAYERLTLFCERVDLPGMLLRTQSRGMTVSELKLALMLGVQQEFEYNQTQQVYVSESLWEIIKLAKDDVLNTVSNVAASIEPNADARKLSQALIAFLNERESTGPMIALKAIKKEASLLFY